MRHADLGGPPRDHALGAAGSANESMVARVWELLDQAHSVPELVARVRTDAALGAGDTYAVERAVAGVIEQLIAAGRIRLVRRALWSASPGGGPVSGRPDLPPPAAE